MNYATVCLVLGAAALFFGLVGVTTNFQGDSAVRIVSRRIRAGLMALGTALIGLSAYLTITHPDTSGIGKDAVIDISSAKAEEVMGASRKPLLALAAHLSSCSTRVTSFEARWPEIPNLQTEDGRLVLGVDRSNSDKSGKPVEMLKALKDALSATEKKDTLFVATAAGGVGKSTALLRIAYDSCKKNLSGNYATVVAALDSRRDLREDADRAAWRFRLDDLRLAVHQAAQGKLVVFVDGFDELFFENEVEARLLVDWLVQEAKATPAAGLARFILLTRKYAWAPFEALKVNHHLLGHFAPPNEDRGYRDNVLRSISFHRFFGPKAKASAPETKDVAKFLDEQVTKLGAWLDGVGLRSDGMTYRDIELAIEGAYENSPEQRQLGDYYSAYAHRRTAEMLHAETSPERLDALLRCAGATWVNDENSPFCRPFQDKRERTLEAAGLRQDVPSPIQDAIAAYAYCSATKAKDNQDPRWVAIAATSRLRESCPRLAQKNICDLDEETRRMFSIECP